MFALFFTLYYALLRGQWPGAIFKYGDIKTILQTFVNNLGTLITSIFGDNQMNTLGDSLFDMVTITDSQVAMSVNVPVYLGFFAFILALITSIGIVVVATKGIKKLFTVFFYGVR